MIKEGILGRLRIRPSPVPVSHGSTWAVDFVLVPWPCFRAPHVACLDQFGTFVAGRRDFENPVAHKA